MLVDDPGDAGDVRIVRHAFVHQGRRTVGQWAVDQIAMTGNPADVGGAPVDIARAVVEDPFVGQRGVQQVAAAGVQHALGFPGGARGVENEQRLLGAHFLRRADLAGNPHQVVVGDVPVRVPADVRSGAAHHDDLLHATGLRVRQRLVDVLLQGDGLAATYALIGSDHHLRAAIDDAPGQCLRREAAEHHRVDRTDARAGQHCHRGLGNHRHVDGHHVTAVHILATQGVGELADLLVELAVGDLAVLRGVVPLPDDRHLIAALGQVPVQAIGRHVQRAVGKPLDIDVMVVEGGALDLAEGPNPVQPCRLFTPESFRVDHRLLIHGPISGLVGQGVLCSLRGHGIHGRSTHGSHLGLSGYFPVAALSRRRTLTTRSIHPSRADRQPRACQTSASADAEYRSGRD